jgi:hypothetical protein
MRNVLLLGLTIFLFSSCSLYHLAPYSNKVFGIAKKESVVAAFSILSLEIL